MFVFYEQASIKMFSKFMRVIASMMLHPAASPMTQIIQPDSHCYLLFVKQRRRLDIKIKKSKRSQIEVHGKWTWIRYHPNKLKPSCCRVSSVWLWLYLHACLCTPHQSASTGNHTQVPGHLLLCLWTQDCPGRPGTRWHPRSSLLSPTTPLHLLNPVKM